MSKPAWPTTGDLQAFLAGANIIEQPPTGDTAGLDYASAVLAGLSAWEDATGYHPFMAAATDATRYYTPDGTDILDLHGGVTAALTSLTIGHSPTSSGTALTANQDYWLMPLNAIAEGRPANWVRFAGRQSGGMRSIVIVGKFGWCANGAIPDDAWRGVLLMAACALGPQLDTLASQGGMTKLTEGDVSYEYGGVMTTWQQEAGKLAARYKRLRVC